MDIRVQKGPKQEGDSWVMITRSPQAWWWLPAGEHPGDMEVTRAWQVMSAIHGYIATHKDKDGNLEIKDDKTGETLPLEFVEIHQPVRHLKKEGEYFACTDFRKPGSQDQYYDIDFWVNQKTGKLVVDALKAEGRTDLTCPTRMPANPTTDRSQWVGPAGVAVCLFITPFCDQGDIASGFRVNGACLHAREVRLQPFEIDEF